jgi:hypothetical protein
MIVSNGRFAAIASYVAADLPLEGVAERLMRIADEYGRILHWLFRTECGSITDGGAVEPSAVKGMAFARREMERV